MLLSQYHNFLAQFFEENVLIFLLFFSWADLFEK
jgi:hypothetical protein